MRLGGARSSVNVGSMPEPEGYLRRWGRGPLAVYLCGILLPVLVALFRSELMAPLGVPVYAVLFWAGPFASAAAVAWSDWPAGWRAVWILLVPVTVAAALGLVFAVLSRAA